MVDKRKDQQILRPNIECVDNAALNHVIDGCRRKRNPDYNLWSAVPKVREIFGML